MKKYFIILLLLHSACFSACSNKQSAAGHEGYAHTAAEAQEDHDDKDHTDAGAGSDQTTLSAEQVESVGIAWGSIEKKELTATLKANGVLRVPNQNRAAVSSVYSGTIKSLPVQEGSMVRKGQVIATIANPEFVTIQNEYLNTVARLKMAELELRRQQELSAGNAGALKNLQAAETDFRTLKNSRAAHEQQLKLMGIKPASLNAGNLSAALSLYSPISGVLSNMAVQIGSFVEASTVVAAVVDNSSLHLDLYVYEKDLPKLKEQQLIHFTLTNNPGKEYDAVIYSLGASFEGESKAVTVHARVEGDKSGLIDGMSITAVISLQKQTKPAVPADAIINVAGQDYIFVMSGEKSVTHEAGKGEPSHGKEFVFRRIPVARGTTDIGYSEITLLKEIPQDAQVVVKGAFFVHAKMSDSGGGHEH